MNLIDMLADDFDGVEEPPEYAVQLWTEDQIRLYFESGGATEGLPEPQVCGAGSCCWGSLFSRASTWAVCVAVQGGGDTSEQFATLLAAALAKQAVVPKPAPGGVLRGVGRQVADAQKKARVVLCNWTGNRGGAGSAHSFTQWAKLPDAQASLPNTLPCGTDAGVLQQPLTPPAGSSSPCAVLLVPAGARVRHARARHAW